MKNIKDISVTDLLDKDITLHFGHQRMVQLLAMLDNSCLCEKGEELLGELLISAYLRGQLDGLRETIR